MEDVKLIVSVLGSSGGGLETHSLAVTVGSSCNSPDVIEDLQNSWEKATHIDDIYFLEEVPGYKIKLIPLSDPYLKQEEKLYLVWLGWYEEKTQPEEEGLLLLDTEKHELFAAVAKSSSEIKEKLKRSFSPYAEGQKETVGKNMRSHLDNTHVVSFADIDGLKEVNELIAQKGFRVVLEKNDKSMKRNRQNHGYGKFSRYLKGEFQV